MECYGKGRRLRGKVAATEAEQPRNPVLQSRNPRNTSMGMTCGSSEGGKRARLELEGLKQHKRETLEASMDISGQKKTKAIKSENQEQEDEMSAMKTGVPISENLKHEGEQRFNTTSALEEVGADDDILSTLSGPPQVRDASGLTSELLQVYELAIPAVKNALISFLITKKPEDVAFMITQANRTFASLYALNADCGSFYNNVRSYIRHCSEFSTAKKELQENMEAVKLVSSYDNISDQSTEAARAVSVIEANLEKAKEYLTSLEARYQETKVLLDKLEAELGQRRTEVADLEAEKIQREEAMAAIEMKHHTIASQAKEAKETLQSILRRREAARAAMEETIALLSTS